MKHCLELSLTSLQDLTAWRNWVWKGRRLVIWVVKWFHTSFIVLLWLREWLCMWIVWEGIMIIIGELESTRRGMVAYRFYLEERGRGGERWFENQDFWFLSDLLISFVCLRFPSFRSESAFKALALAIKEAVSRTGLDDVPSTKGSYPFLLRDAKQDAFLFDWPKDSLFYLPWPLFPLHPSCPVLTMTCFFDAAICFLSRPSISRSPVLFGLSSGVL